MDAVELTYPVDVAAASVSKLMGSDGFGRSGVGVGVTVVKKVEPRDLDRVIRIPPIGACGAVPSEKDVANAGNASEMLYQHKNAEANLDMHNDQLLIHQSEDLAKNLASRDASNARCPASEEVQLPCKLGKVTRNNSTCSKRARSIHMEDASAITSVDEYKDSSDKSLTRSCSLEKNHLAKQKNIGNKRGDKRSNKVPMKNKYDAFTLKGCSPSFNASPGGNNFLGFYGLKSDTHDITKLVDDLSLNEILEGNFKCPSLCKEKGKKSTNSNENLMQSVRKVCSMLQTQRPGKTQNLVDIDTYEDKKISTSLLSTIPVAENGADSDNRDSCMVDPPSANEDCYGKPEMFVHPLDLPIYPPKDMCERLALPPPKDLDSLLLEATKPTLSSKSLSDLRSGKQMARRGCLPPFAWSHAFNGHSRNNSDAAKLPMSRTTCQGRWAKVASPAILSANPVGHTDLDSISYNEGLVPSVERKVWMSVSKIASQGSTMVPWCDWASSSSATCPLVSDGTLAQARLEAKDEIHERRSPSILAAAQTLCSIASKEASVGSLKWSRMPLHKGLKPRKLKSKHCEEDSMLPKSMSKDVAKSHDQILPSKKPKLSNKDIYFPKAPMNWSTPRSSRSSPSRSIREFVAEARDSVTHITKQPSMTSPMARVFDKPCVSHQKPRASTSLYWNKGRDGLH